MSLGPLMVGVAGTALDAGDRAVLAHPLVGGVVLFTRNYAERAQLAALCAEIRALRSPPLLIAVDQEGGRVQRFGAGFSRLPAPRRIGQVYDADAQQGLAMARALGWLMAAELLACGLDLSFMPCVDLDYGLSQVIGDRALHARAAVVAQLAIAYVHGMREAGMAATAKHFPGHGAVVADSHRDLPVDRRELADLQEDLLPYRRLIDNALPAVMVAHVLFPAVDALPASFSRRWIQGVLREELRFGGLVVSDDLSMAGAASMGELPERAARALAAGCDLLLVCNDRPGVERLLRELAVTPDPVSQLRLVRMRGAKAAPFETLAASAAWQRAREWLARGVATPELDFPAGRADTRGSRTGP
ncbi:MAG TPA: beta-N-acetylhexosaminidase [Steroidobacteraceae bacterium]|nr:beta-N-acetylhexosaminidase [Steroidobacteraceae bacterium]